MQRPLIQSSAGEEKYFKLFVVFRAASHQYEYAEQNQSRANCEAAAEAAAAILGEVAETRKQLSYACHAIPAGARQRS